MNNFVGSHTALVHPPLRAPITIEETTTTMTAEPSVSLSRTMASCRLPGALNRHIFCHHTTRR